NDGVWNEEGAALRIRIMPPFWETWWFRAAVIIAIVGVTLLLYRRQMGMVSLATELKAAHDAQMSIMPHGDPEVQGFEISGVCIPASEVGGDFFDYFWIDGDHTRFGIAVGDVSGKAMKAAMIAVMSSGMISSRADESFSPGKAMTHLNRPLYAKTDEHVFTALCLGALDIVGKTFTFSIAGAVDPLLKRGGSATQLIGTGSNLPVGAMSDTVYGESTIALGEEDVLVLISDGVADAWNSAKEFYEYERLRNLIEKMDTSHLPAREIKDRIIDDVRRFAGGARQHDDMTVVVVKRV
ncbi:MAG TPA: PP2C family protein-serine/threonine phosphatase, partial [Candidatus Bathyarchaeia archaeon]|nr:PP2C family protein-serine/threonine phosphatase [Candidatus Bathyarchaeia archaeon]